MQLFIIKIVTCDIVKGGGVGRVFILLKISQTTSYDTQKTFLKYIHKFTRGSRNSWFKIEGGCSHKIVLIKNNKNKTKTTTKSVRKADEFSTISRKQ